MSRSLPLFVLLGSLGALTVSTANAAETHPSAADTPSSTSTSPADTPTHRPEPSAASASKPKPKPKNGESAKEIKEKDKAKAAQSGDDATLRDLPSPAQKGSE